MKSLLFLVVLLALTGCGTITTLPQNQVVAQKTSQSIALGEVDEKNIVASLEKFIGQLEKPADAICIVKGKAVSDAQMNAVKSVLAQMSCERMYIENVAVASQLDVRFISLSLQQQKANAVPFESQWFSTSAVNSQFGSSTMANIAAQAHQPKDVVMPAKIGSPNPIATSGAVERYQKGSVRALKSMGMEAGSSK